MRKIFFWIIAAFSMTIPLSARIVYTTTVYATAVTHAAPSEKDGATDPVLKKHKDTEPLIKKGRRIYAIAPALKQAVFVKTTSSSPVITIPATIELDGVSYKITGIADRALKGKKELKKITIGKNVKTIGQGAFNGCENLKKIIMESAKLSQIGDYAWKGIHPAARLIVPQKKRSAYRKLLRAAGQDGSVLVTDSIKKVAIDAGHQKSAGRGMEPIGPGASKKKLENSGGAVGVQTGTPEYELNLKVAKKLRRELKARGYEVVMTRTSHEVDLSNRARAQIANASGADIYIRIHADSMPTPGVRGASVSCPSAKNPYIGQLSAASKRLSECLLQDYCSATGIKNRGLVLRDDLTGTNWSSIPVCLIELGFLSNPSEDALMQEADMQEKMARGIADGVDAYFWE